MDDLAAALPLEGIRVLEVAEYGIVPSAGAVLADWGAEVIKIERPGIGDPTRRLAAVGGVASSGTWDVTFQQINRNKRGIALDMANDAARPVFEELVRRADVFLTNFLPNTRRKLRIEPDDLAPLNPRLVYGRASGQGQRGAEAADPAFDGVAFWARGGLGFMHSPSDGGFVPPRGATGDITTGLNLAGGIAAALLRRERTGRGGVVDAALLASALWFLAIDIGVASVRQQNPGRASNSKPPRNPMAATYRTQDDRWLIFAMIQGERFFARLCRALALEGLLDDERFTTDDARKEHRVELWELIRDRLAAEPLEHWRKRLDAEGCLWHYAASPLEVLEDPQVAANGYLFAHPEHPTARLASSPIQFDEHALTIRRPAPELGAHTDEVLSELALSSEQIEGLRRVGAVA